MEEIWVLENKAIYVNWNFCGYVCCFAYCFIFYVFFCVHNYTCTKTITTTTKSYSNNTKNEHEQFHINWSFCADPTSCCHSDYCINLLWFISSTEYTIRDEEEQNDTVTMTVICKR